MSLGSFFGTEPSSQQTTTASTDLPEWQRPYVEDVSRRAQQLSYTPQQYYPGSTVVPMSQETQQGLTSATNTAMGDNLGSNAMDFANNTMNGDYLYGGQGFNAALDAAQRRIMPSIRAQATQAGQYDDSSGRDLAMTQALGDSFANQYGQERQNQIATANMVPQIQQSMYMPSQQLRQVGQAREDLTGRNMQDAISRFNFNQTEPMDRLNRYKTLVTGNYGNTSTQSQPLYQNTGSSLLGLASMFF